MGISLGRHIWGRLRVTLIDGYISHYIPFPIPITVC